MRLHFPDRGKLLQFPVVNQSTEDCIDQRIAATGDVVAVMSDLQDMPLCFGDEPSVPASALEDLANELSGINPSFTQAAKRIRQLIIQYA